MTKTLIYFPPEYRDLALKIRENYIEHHHGEVDLVSETDQNDIHTTMNKVTGALLFIFPLTLSMIPLIVTGIPICSVVTFAAV